jgi:hypothetical protein
VGREVADREDGLLPLAKRLEAHHTPKHGIWLNVAEIELSVCKRRCPPERIPTMEDVRALTRAWNKDRNSRQSKADWQFSTDDARIKLKRLYPKF